MKLKRLLTTNRSWQLAVLILLGIFCLCKPEACWALSREEVANGLNVIWSDLASIIQLDSIKVAALVLAWGMVGFCALLHKPIGPSIFRAFIVTVVVMSIHKFI